jgi:DNA-directed RNA polymerase subunit K/omega
MSKKQTKKKINKEESDDEISETMEETDDIIDEEDNFQENDEFEEDDGYNDIEELEEPEIFNGCALDKIIEDEIDDIDNNDNSEIEEVIVEDKLLKDKDRISANRLTKYEMVRILGERTKQLTMGAKPLIKNYEGLNYDKISEEELKLNMIPYKIKRTLPNGKYEIWTLDELFKDHLITLLE